ncbi:MAG TPA: acetyl-CoA carboxylase biotin carboxyl carrier protein [Phycisphaerae bacterium]|nr:acetyl-CoA carboxylase biotin carboxyl carrier protein [Phycisphaerae bacterium]HRR85765.1 acetyl-CoA carboxylase biotin carboxyl carrier protein [Phycisphaerae bacterium]
MIDVQQVRELIQLMVENDLSEIRVRQGETAISLRKAPAGVPLAGAPAMAAVPATLPVLQPAQAPVPPAIEKPTEDGLVPVLSPMVGTYYQAPDPDSEPYVRVGMEIGPDTPICIIEAMKVFNEIKAEVAGVIERILVQDQQAVEFGQPLMLVRPR